MSFDISFIERDTNLSKDTLRIWERRYGFPKPERDTRGERIYSLEQLERLRLVSRLLQLGLRPAKVAPMPLSELQALVRERSQDSAARGALAPVQLAALDALRRHDLGTLTRLLQTNAMQLGLARMVTETIAPLTTEVGHAWARGEIQVFEEHMYTECVGTLLRQAIIGIPATAGESRPRILLTTVPQEAHGLGLLMAHALFALEGCDCLSLGLQTPVSDIVQAARAQQADVVALSFSICMRASDVQASLRNLRATLPPDIGIWAGGRHLALARCNLDSFVYLPELGDIGRQLAHWRLV